MSKKINLKALHSVGKLSASIGAGIENAQSDGIDAMFDDFPLTTKYEADHVMIPFINQPIVSTKLSFIPPIPGNKFRVITNIKGALSNHGNILTRAYFNTSFAGADKTHYNLMYYNTTYLNGLDIIILNTNVIKYPFYLIA